MSECQSPSTPICVVDHRHVLRNEETFIMKEKILTIRDDTCFITTVDGDPRYKIDPSYISLRERRRLLDVQGHPLCYMKRVYHKVLHHTFVGYSDEDCTNEIFRISSEIFTLHKKMNITFKDKTTGNDRKMTMKADLIGRKETMECEGAVIARVHRRITSGRHLVLGKQAYEITIASGVDAVFVLALLCCYDELHEYEGSEGGLVGKWAETEIDN